LSKRFCDDQDADEATVLGASLFAANLSTSFRLRKFGLTDMSMYGVQMTVEEVHQDEPAAAPEGKDDVRNLLPYMKRLPIKRLVTFNGTTKDPIRFSIAYNTSASSGLPPGVDEPHLASYEITGINKAIERYNTSGVVSLRFEADYGGVLKLDKAEALVEYTVMEDKIVEVPVEGAGNSTKNATGSNSTINLDDDTNSTASVSEDEPEASSEDSSDSAPPEEPAPSSENSNDTATNKTAAMIKRIQVPRKKVARVPLSISGKGWSREKLSGDSLASSTSTLAGWVQTETVKRDNAAAKNDLESYIIKTREAIETDELLIKVSTEEQRTAFVEKLTAMEDWLYSDEGEGQGAAEFRAKLKSLKDVGEPIKDRWVSNLS
jgi:hypoxia up-regulated 1